MTDPIHDDPNPDDTGPRCVTCGEPIETGLAGWEHTAPADHDAVGRDAE